MAKTIRNRTERKAFKRSTIAACVMAVSAIHAQAQDATDNPEILEEVVVYGIKQSLQNAQDIKREAATVKDVITASDINALPDKSITEALARVPGVGIERFEASDDPDHFTVEGGNVNLRGLTRVRSEFNGRDAFSASGNGGLNFDDIPPELVGSVEVIKNQTADMVEGGIAGTINLITRKPFDSDELIVGGTLKANYTENLSETTPTVSFITSNTWDTSAGRFGALLSVSTSEIKSRADGIGVYNYYNPGLTQSEAFTTSDGQPFGNREVIVPLAGAARQQFNERDRFGAAGSLQWSNPEETVTLTAELIHSSSELAWSERFLEYPEQPFALQSEVPDDDQISNPFRSDGSIVYDEWSGNQSLFQQTFLNCNSSVCSFDSGLIEGANPVNDWTGSGPLGLGEAAYTSGTRARSDEREINDYSFNINATPNENFELDIDLQWVKARTEIVDNTLHGRFLSNTFLDVSGDGQIDFLSNSLFRDNAFTEPTTNLQSPDSYFARSAMDHYANNEGSSFTFSADAEYTFDDSLLKSVKGGVRMSEREQTVRESAFNWGNLSEVWAGGGVSFEDLGDDYYESFTFKDHAGNNGNFQTNSTFLFPRLSLVEQDSLEGFYNQWVAPDDSLLPSASWQNLSNRGAAEEGSRFLSSERYVTTEDRSSAYVRFDFGDDSSDIRWDVNFGLRFISYQLTSTGANTYPNPFGANLRGEGRSPLLPALNPGLNPLVERFANGGGGETFTVKGERFTKTLPSLNIKIEPIDDLIFRFAASQAVFLPQLDKVRNQVVIGEESSGVGRAYGGIDGNGQGQLASIDGTALFDANGNPFTASEFGQFSQDAIVNMQPFNLFDADGNAYWSQDDNGNYLDGDGNIITDVTAVPAVENENLAPLSDIASVQFDGFTSNDAGNPLLKPEVSTNIDLAVEWYFDELGSITGTLFYKDIDDFFRNSSIVRNVGSVDNSFTQPVILTQTENAGSAELTGFELAGQTTLGFIHNSLDNFGFQGSFTYIDAEAKNTNTQASGSDQEFSFRNFDDLPLEGLSDKLASFTAYYQNDSLEVRFAYSWRSAYLLNSRDVISFSPVYSDDTGQLDFSANYRISDQVTVGVEATNLTDEVTKTSIQYNQEGVLTPRSFFSPGRAAGVFIKASL